MNGSALTDDNDRVYDALIPGIFGNLGEQVMTATIKNEKDFRGFYEAFRSQFMSEVSMTRLIMIATISVSVSSRFSSNKGNNFANFIQNRESHYEFLETHADEHFSDMSKAATLIVSCKDTSWIQVDCTFAFSTSSIIGRYEATKNHFIAHIPDNTISGRSGASIGQVETNPLEMSKRHWDIHVSYMSNNELISDMPCRSTLRCEKKSSI